MPLFLFSTSGFLLDFFSEFSFLCWNFPSVFALHQINNLAISDFWSPGFIMVIHVSYVSTTDDSFTSFACVSYLSNASSFLIFVGELYVKSMLGNQHSCLLLGLCIAFLRNGDDSKFAFAIMDTINIGVKLQVLLPWPYAGLLAWFWFVPSHLRDIVCLL